MKTSNQLYFCEVKVVDDNQAGLRIKVQIPMVDTSNDPEDWPWVFPLLPKHLHINPQLGECVIVIFKDQNAPLNERFFIGPVISQQYFLSQDNYYHSALRMIEGSGCMVKPKQNPIMDPENRGNIIDRNNIAIQGRDNSDIIFKPKELLLRCGFQPRQGDSDVEKRLYFNRTDPAYILMRYRYSRDENDKEYKSSINIVADRINLLSHDSRNVFQLTDPQELITNNEMSKIMETAHPMVYGDKLVEYLQAFMEIFLKHSHSWPQDRAGSTLEDKYKTFCQDTQQLQNMLSQSIKIN